MSGVNLHIALPFGLAIRATTRFCFWGALMLGVGMAVISTYVICVSMVMYAKSGIVRTTYIQPVRLTEQSILGIRVLDVHRAARCACHVRHPPPTPRQLAVAVRVAARHAIAAASLAESVATSARATANEA